jgi:iron complex transport system ATP-binding protein
VNLVEVRGLTFGYDIENVINSLNFDLPKSVFFSIVGPNGSGKSTLLKLISRSLKARAGTIRFHGKDILDFKPQEFSKLVASLPQKIELPFDHIVENFVMMGRFPFMDRFSAPSENDIRKVNDALVLTDTTDLRERGINELSGGERQRVFIAQAIAQEPKLLLLDEPTSQLDIGHKMSVMELLRKLNRENGITVAVVLHDLNLAAEFSDRIMILRGGQKYAEGTPQEVLNYGNIEEVYKTLVIVKENPLTNKPYIFPVSKHQQ